MFNLFTSEFTSSKVKECKLQVDYVFIELFLCMAKAAFKHPGHVKRKCVGWHLQVKRSNTKTFARIDKK